MKKPLIFLLCGLLIGVAAAWALTAFVAPNWHRSAVDNTFRQVTSKLDQGGEAFVYLHAEKVNEALRSVLAGLQMNVTALPEARQAQAKKGLDAFTMMFKKYGLEEISGLGFSSFAVKPGLHRVRVIIHHRPGRDQGLIWKIAGPAPRNLDELDLMTADTALAFVSDYNIGYLLGWMDGTFGNKNGGVDPGRKTLSAMLGLQAAGLDVGRLLKSYGNRLGFLLTLDPERMVTLPLGKTPLSIPEPAFALLVRVNDTYLFDTLKTRLAPLGQIIISDEGGVKKIAFSRLPLPIPFEPVIAQKGEWLLAASLGSLVDKAFGAEGPRLTDGEDFKTIAYKLPRRGNGFGYAGPLIPRVFARMFRENKAAFPAPAALEKLAAFLEQGKGFCYVLENSDQGFVYTANHGFEISSLPGLIEAFTEIARGKVSKQPEAVPATPPAEGEPKK